MSNEDQIERLHAEVVALRSLLALVLATGPYKAGAETIINGFIDGLKSNKELTESQKDAVSQIWSNVLGAIQRQPD